MNTIYTPYIEFSLQILICQPNEKSELHYVGLWKHAIQQTSEK